MPRLLPTTTVWAAALLATAATAQEAAPAVEAAVSVQAEASAPVLSAAPVAMKVNVGYVEDMASYGKVVVVPTAYVKLLVDGSVFIAKQGSGLGALGGASTNSVKAKGSYKVAGIDKAFAQGLAKQAYDDFVTQLRGAGYTVLTYDDIKSRDFVAAAARDTGSGEWGLPTEKAIGGRDTYVVAAPSDEMAFKIGFTGVFAEFIKYGKPKFTDAAMVIPTYTIHAPQAAGETDSGFNRIEASVSVSPGMNLQHASAMWMGAPKVRMGGKNLPGVALKEPVINLSENAGTLTRVDTTPTGANALSKALSIMGGGGSISSSSANYTYTIDPALYSAAALRGVVSFNGEVAKSLAGQ